MDKRRKKQKLDEWRAQQRANARAKLPLPPAELKLMFDMLDVEFPRQGCDHSRRLTKAWLESRGHDVEKVFVCLDDHGGHCDCEVLANVEQSFEDAMHDAD
jgi:hypothetical protein